MDFVKIIYLFLFLRVELNSITLENTIPSKYVYLNTLVKHLSLELYDSCLCIRSSVELDDLKTLIIKECFGFIAVIQVTSVASFINKCKIVFLFVETADVGVCDAVSERSLASYFVIFINTNATMISNEIKKCSSSLDTLNFVVITLQDEQILMLNSTIAASNSFVQSSVLGTNRELLFPNFRGKLIKLATFHYPPFLFIKNNSGSVEYDGIEMSLFKDLATYLNFTWELAPLKSPGRFGVKLSNGTVMGGIQQALREGAADVAFCNIWQRELSSADMEFGPPLNMIYVTFIVRRPYQLMDQWQALLMIFTIDVWLTIATTFFVVTLTYWRGCHVTSLTRKPNLLESAVIMLGILTVSSSYTVSVTLTTRVITLWWFFFALLLMTAVTSCIVTRLTLPLYSPRIDTVQQLVEEGYYWTDPSYHTSNATNKEFFFNLNSMCHSTFETHYRYIEPQEIQSHILYDRNIVFPVQKWGQECMILNIDGIHRDTDLSNFRVMRDYTQNAFTSFGFRKHCGFNEVFTRVMQRFVDLGLWDYQKHRVAHHRANRKYLLVEKDTHDFSHPEQLTLIQIYPVFILLVMGHSIAVAVFIGEFIYYKICSTL